MATWVQFVFLGVLYPHRRLAYSKHSVEVGGFYCVIIMYKVIDVTAAKVLD